MEDRVLIFIVVYYLGKTFISRFSYKIGRRLAKVTRIETK